jgi:hypothetical protein
LKHKRYKNKHDMTTTICSNCSQVFEGRSNQKYCGSRCKSAVNNNRMAERNKESKQIERRIRENRRILIALHSLFGNEEIPYSVLSKTKLDSTFNNGISPDFKTVKILDYSLKKLENNNYLITKLV